ncbi:CamS family sex pheromone protein [Bacillus fonticola]|uniref:CamS family sex pheromone protein n=1 Tax=Bacillus fonticola TaxID=2728853 RepID=UPI0014745071|nr:CamS family sex pheromone protein [Bacillus fonticola]
MKKRVGIGLLSLLFVVGCSPNFSEEGEDVVQETDNTTEEVLIPSNTTEEGEYRTVLPFVPSEVRGLTVSNLNTRLDMDEFEESLVRIAKKQFTPDKYFFREGTYLKREQVLSWLGRQSEDNEAGLNPPLGVSSEASREDQQAANTESPIYLASLLEHNYMVQEEDQLQLGGVVVGLALNSVYYYQTEIGGPQFETEINQDVMVAEGKRMAGEVLQRMRQDEELANVPITIALYEQEARSSVTPGNILMYSYASGNTLGDWEEVNEDYILFPSTEATDLYRDQANQYDRFKEAVEEYFPNFYGVVGQGFFVNGQLQSLDIEIPIQFYGKTETIGFVQYVSGLITQYFPAELSVQIEVTSSTGTEAIIVRETNNEETDVHIL